SSPQGSLAARGLRLREVIGVSGSAGSAQPSGRFPSRFRVRKRPEFLSIQERGSRVSTARFVLILSLSSASASPRLGITASRRVGNSVVRSRAKRLIREAFRATRELWPVGIDLVVIVKRAPGESKLESVVSEWHAARPQIERKVRALLAPPSSGESPPRPPK
ncbi:MAG: ribonuclease P protein component, partial [Polyangiaceae bacterium]